MKSGKRSEPLAKVGIARRRFLKKSLAAGVATAIPFPFVNLRYGLAAPEPIRVGVVGCGGRGTGAALNVLQAKTKVIYPPARALRARGPMRSEWTRRPGQEESW